MARRSSRPHDANKLARAIVAYATGETIEGDPYGGKNPVAVELGRLGGQKGGKARAEALSPERRSEIARRAANARWHRSTNDS